MLKNIKDTDILTKSLKPKNWLLFTDDNPLTDLQDRQRAPLKLLIVLIKVHSGNKFFLKFIRFSKMFTTAPFLLHIKNEEVLEKIRIKIEL